MKFLLILPFIVFNLFALTKTYDIGSPVTSDTSYNGFKDDESACLSKADEFDSYPPSETSVLGNSNYNSKCVNPNSDLLSLKDIISTTVYSGLPRCTVYYTSDYDKTNGHKSYLLSLHSVTSATCIYQCSSSAKAASHSSQAVWDEDKCEWMEPCTDTPIPNSVPTSLSIYNCSYKNLTASEKEKISAVGIVCNECDGYPYDEHTCLSPNVLDTSTIPPRCIPASPCADNEILDVNGSCVDASIPSDFPSDKGHQSVQKHDYSQADCIPDTVIKTDTSYFKIIGWDDFSKKCVFASFYCNSGLTFDKLTNQCVSPSDETDGLSDGISQELLDSCQSGKWAKRWTYDYCGQELCYIPLDVQDYNLQCNRKYLEYDCTSDYRIKYFKSVSCGERSQDDYQDVNMSIVGSDDGSPDNHLVDANSTVQNSDIASIINSGVSSLHNDLDGLAKTANEINGNIISLGGSLNGIDNKLNNINGSLSGINSKLNDINNSLNPASVGDYFSLSNAYDNMTSFIGDSKKSLLDINTRFEDAKAVISSGFTFKPPAIGSCVDPSAVIFGKNIKLTICESMSVFQPVGYLLFSLFFVFFAIKIYFYALKD